MDLKGKITWESDYAHFLLKCCCFFLVDAAAWNVRTVPVSAVAGDVEDIKGAVGRCKILTPVQLVIFLLNIVCL